MGKSFEKNNNYNIVYVIMFIIKVFLFFGTLTHKFAFFSIQISHSSKKITINVGIITCLRNSKELCHFFKNFLLRLGRMEGSSIASGK